MDGLCAAASYLAGLVFGLMEISMACYTRETISEVAREATRYAMAHGSTCQTGSGASCMVTAATVNTYAASGGWPNLGGGTMTVNTNYPDGNKAPVSRVQVTVTYLFPFRVPMIPASTLTMSSTSIERIVQ